jgi:hypothetical protein
MYNFEKHCKFSQTFVSTRMLIFQPVYRVEINDVSPTTFFDGYFFCFRT